MYDRPVGEEVKDIAIGARGVGFDSWAGQIRHIVAKILPTLHYFFGAVLPSAEMGAPPLVTRFRIMPRVRRNFFFY